MNMRSLPLLVLVLLTVAGRAQEVIGTDGPLAEATHLVKRLKLATTDPQRDSINLRLKEAVRTVLESEDALTRPLDELPLSRVDAPDGSFRLITWNIPYSDGHHGYEGFLLHTKGRGSALVELQDRSGTMDQPELPITNAERWYGALYYDVVQVKSGGRTYYTLLGWKGHSRVETRKVIEVLSFKGGRPVFGATLFGSGRDRKARVVFAYNFQVSMSLRGDQKAGRIIFSHLVPAKADQVGQYAFYGPDQSFDSYDWDKSKWVFQRDIDVRDITRDGRPYNAPPSTPRR